MTNEELEALLTEMREGVWVSLIRAYQREYDITVDQAARLSLLLGWEVGLENSKASWERKKETKWTLN